MKKYKYLSCVFAALSILLTNAMCATVAFQYCDMRWKILYEGYSAPAGTAFLLAIPYGTGMIICAVLAWLFHKKYQKSM